MRIAFFNHWTIRSSWSNLQFPNTLRSLGHEVIDGVIPINEYGQVMYTLGPHKYKKVMAGMPTLEQLRSCDVIFASAPEFYEPWLMMLYKAEDWRKLPARKVAFFVESSEREDMVTSIRYENFSRWFDYHFFPDIRDAEKYKGMHTSACVDTDMYKPCVLHRADGSECTAACDARRMAEKKYEAAFLGTLYPKRLLFLSRLLPLIQDIDFKSGEVRVLDLGGECQLEWAQLWARNLRQIKVHVGFPSANAKMLTSRQYETLACGTFMLSYRVENSPFIDGVHCRMYDSDKPEECAELIRYYLEHEDEREAIAAAGLAEIRRDYSNETRLKQILGMVAPEFDPHPALTANAIKQQREHGILLQHV